MAAVVVQKFGGTSVAGTERIRNVAARALKRQRDGASVVLVVSAMSGETDRLLSLAREISLVASRDELDVAAASGEQVTSALVALAIRAIGGKSRSFQAHQLPIRTDSTYGDARITGIDTRKLRSSLERGEIPVIAGFQGVNAMQKITTLGRGGSDTSAVAVAASLGAVCEIFTDVDGVYSADPGVCEGATKIDHLSYRQMLALAGLGAKVLHRRSVALASRFSVPLTVQSSFREAPGTLIDGLEDTEVRAIACDRDVALIDIEGLELGAALARLSAARILVERAEGRDGFTRLHVRRRDADRVSSLLEGREKGRVSEELAKVSVVGHGLAADATIVDKVTRLLAAKAIPVHSISVDEWGLSALVGATAGDEAVRTLHQSLVIEGNIKGEKK